MKAGFKTSEFWLTLIVSVAKTFFPDIPDEAIFAVIAFVLSRLGVKISGDIKDAKLARINGIK